VVSVDRTAILRRALWATAVMNLGGVVLFLFPDSLGELAGLPVPVPRVYSAYIALVIAIFCGAYAWLARSPTIDKPLLLVGAIGKAGFFGVVAICWSIGDVAGRAVIGASADLAFALLFAGWLFAETRSVTRID